MAVGPLADCLARSINCAFSIYARRLWSSILPRNRFGENNHIPLASTSGLMTVTIFLGGKRIAFVPLSSGNPYYYLSDHLGSTAVIASGDGKTIQWEADYFPFGAVRQVFKNIASNNYEFTGYEFDSDTGYNYAVARFDAGRWGRFLSPDPYLGSMDVTNPQLLNRYSYVSNNPVNFVDPRGLDKVKLPAPPPTPCAGTTGCALSGNNMFDTLNGAPGTYVSVDMYGNVGFGFDIGLRAIALNLIDVANAQRERVPFPSLFPDSYDHITGGFLSVQQDFGGVTEAVGVIADVGELVSLSTQFTNDLLSHGIFSMGQLSAATQGGSQTALELLDEIQRLERQTEKVGNDFLNLFGIH